MNLIVSFGRSIGLAAAALALAGCAAMSPGATPVGDPGFGFALWSPGRADTAQVKVPCSGRNLNSAGCVGQSPTPTLTWTFPRTAMRSFVILKGDPAGRADFGVKHRAACGIAPVAAPAGFSDGKMRVIR